MKSIFMLSISNRIATNSFSPYEKRERKKPEGTEEAKEKKGAGLDHNEKRKKK